MIDVLSTAENKLLFEPGNVESCKTALNFLFDANSEQRTAWGNKLKSEIEINFNHVLETKRYEKVFDEILRAGHSGTLRMQSR
jgi:hypothetical protein